MEGITSDNGAVLAGYTHEVFALSDGPELHLLMKPDADYNGTITAFDCDAQEMVRINAWLFTFDAIDNFTTLHENGTLL